MNRALAYKITNLLGLEGMNNWFVVNLGDALMADALLEGIKVLWQSEYGNGNLSNELAVFIRHESEGDLHCVVKVYFAPCTVALAEELGALSCVKPSAQGLGLLIGPEGAHQALFSEKYF